MANDLSEDLRAAIMLAHCNHQDGEAVRTRIVEDVHVGQTTLHGITYLVLTTPGEQPQGRFAALQEYIRGLGSWVPTEQQEIPTLLMLPRVLTPGLDETTTRQLRWALQQLHDGQIKVAQGQPRVHHELEAEGRVLVSIQLITDPPEADHFEILLTNAPAAAILRGFLQSQGITCPMTAGDAQWRLQVPIMP